MTAEIESWVLPARPGEAVPFFFDVSPRSAALTPYYSCCARAFRLELDDGPIWRLYPRGIAASGFGSASDEAFHRKWSQLSESARKVVASLLEEGGHSVKETAVRRAAMRLFNIDSNTSSEVVRKAKLEFIQTDLVKLIQNVHSGDELSVHPTWEFYLRRQVAEWSATQSRDK